MRPTRPMEPEDATRLEPRGTPESILRLTCVSVTHRTHSTETVGRIAPEDPVAAARRIHEEGRVTEAMVLSTCNRVEVYVSTRTKSEEDRSKALEAVDDGLDLPSDFQIYTGLEVPRHLARVSAGLESAILGEDEIIGQVGDALTAAKDEGLASGVLGRVGDAALRVGRSCRTETDIDEGPTDYGGAVCRALEDAADDTPETVVVVGAGGMARTVSEALDTRWDVRIDVANRSPAHGLPSDDGRWWSLESLDEALAEADAVVTATAADEPVFDVHHLEDVDDGLAVVDLSTPPDVSEGVRSHPGLYVRDLDDIAGMVRSSTNRTEAVARAEAVVDDAVQRLADSERENRAEDVLRALHREAMQVEEAELEKAKARLRDGDGDAEEVLEDFGEALASRVLASPTQSLRDAAREGDETVIRAASRLFDLEDVEVPQDDR